MYTLAADHPDYWRSIRRMAGGAGEAVTSPVPIASAAGQSRPDGAYTWGGSPAEEHRLQQQRAVLTAHSAALLDRVPLPPGGSAVDLGCGPAGILDLLSARAGPGGQVTGVDLADRYVLTARAFAGRHGLDNVQVLTADARHTGLPAATFDVVHARLVLANISRPDQVAAEMARLAKPGGWVAALEPDLLGLCYPPHPAVDQLTKLFATAIRHDGADPHLGRRLPHLFRAVGLADARAEARTDVYPAGHPQRTVLLDLARAIRPKIVMHALAGEDELDRLDAAARRHLAHPDTLIAPVTYFLAWAHKPLT
jgi:SAM-dependent methyltransferase